MVQDMYLTRRAELAEAALLSSPLNLPDIRTPEGTSDAQPAEGGAGCAFDVVAGDLPARVLQEDTSQYLMGFSIDSGPRCHCLLGIFMRKDCSGMGSVGL